jgi:hypothetical protein
MRYSLAKHTDLFPKQVDKLAHCLYSSTQKDEATLRNEQYETRTPDQRQEFPNNAVIHKFPTSLK